MEGGEYVISKDAVDKYGIDIFDTLNLQKFEPGGFAGTYSGGYSGPTKIGPIGDLLSKEDLERILEKASKATSGDPRIIQSTKKALTDELKLRAEITEKQNALENKKIDELEKANDALERNTTQIDKVNKIESKTIKTKELELDNIKSTHSQMKMISEEQNSILANDVNRNIQGIGYAANVLTSTLEESTEHIDRLGYAASSLSTFGDPALGFA